MTDLFQTEDTRKSAVDTIVDKIKLLLIEKKLRPGDMIPTETNLSESLHVSRGPIREAMKILSAYGVVEIRRGAGTFISQTNNKKLFDPLMFSILVNSTDFDELIEVRNMMEKEIIQLCLQNATEEEFRELDSIMDLFAAVMNEDRDLEIINKQGNALDLKYHKFLGRMTHNTIMEKIYQFVIEMFAPTINAKRGYKLHYEMHRAIMDRNLEKALQIVEDHTASWKKYWEQRTVL